jgi:hypothetical protein
VNHQHKAKSFACVPCSRIQSDPASRFTTGLTYNVSSGAFLSVRRLVGNNDDAVGRCPGIPNGTNPRERLLQGGGRNILGSVVKKRGERVVGLIGPESIKALIHRALILSRYWYVVKEKRASASSLLPKIFVEA